MPLNYSQQRAYRSSPHMTYAYKEPRWNDIDRGKLMTQGKFCPIAVLSTTNPTWIDRGANLCLRGERPTTNP
jgi:hypothetical protein